MTSPSPASPSGSGPAASGSGPAAGPVASPQTGVRTVHQPGMLRSVSGAPKRPTPSRKAHTPTAKPKPMSKGKKGVR